MASNRTDQPRQAAQAAKQGGFQPRVEAEEGDPTRGDYVIGAIVALVVLAGVLWAMGILNF
ncbi:MAG TPA: hypothetical protein VHN78_04765 [Chloroflexota bacterium]|nr:hypothetical protein [Chloroflexota bacterium]HEX2184799.1 hypothetical protein [Chloroflexota bacterium]